MILIFLSLYLLVSWYYGYRFFGDGKSEWGWFLMGGSFLALTSYGLYTVHNLPLSWFYTTLIPITVLSILLIRKLNPWGEFFPHVTKPLNKGDVPSWMFNLINKVAAVKYTEETTVEKKIHWKMTGWIVRQTIFGFLPFLTLAVCYWTIAPLFMSLFLGLGTSFIYRRSFLHEGGGDKTKRAEMLTGGFCGALLILSVLGILVKLS